MKNLWLFFVRYNAFFWFIMFFVISLLLVVRNNNYQKSAFINSSNIITGSFYQKLSSWKSYLFLSETNQNLAIENASLRQKLQYYIAQDSIDSVHFKDSIEIGRYEFIIASVANNSIHQKNNYLTLDKGIKDGVKTGMGVMTSNGIVGVVLNVSTHFSTVQSLLHPATKISVTLDSTDVLGSLVWGNNIDSRFAMVRDIPNHVVLHKGQKVFTSGFSLFPKGIMVGEVTETGITSGESFLDVRIKLSTNFSNLQYVYLVKDNLEAEKNNLEATNDDHE